MNGLVIGMQFIIIVSAFTGLGYWLDVEFENSFPVLLILFLLIGFGVGLYIMLRESASFSKREGGRDEKDD